jgi:hypothetical protein
MRVECDDGVHCSDRRIQPALTQRRLRAVDECQEAIGVVVG